MLQLHVSDLDPIQLSIGTEPEAVLICEPAVYVSIADYYEGPYTVTPDRTTQTLPIDNKTALHDIVVNPIPSCYGLITWDGSTLTVS